MIELANAVRAEVEQACSRFRTWGEPEAIRDRGAGTWTRKEILGHLIDSAANNHQRVIRAQLASSLRFPDYEQEAWVSLQHYRDRSWKELVDLWAGLNGHLAAAIEWLPDDKGQTPVTIGDASPKPLEAVMQDYLRHMRHHLDQIRAAETVARSGE